MKKQYPIIYAFIDSQNLNLGVRSQGWKLNFQRFRVFLEEKYSISKTFLFIGYIPTNQNLYTQLQQDGYILIFKPNYQKAIIVSGDGDFHCLIKYLLSKKKLLKIIVPNKKYSSLLREFSQFIVPIGLFKNKLKR